MTFQIAPARTQADLQAVAALFDAYARSLPVDLAYQDFESEVAGLPGKYAPPAAELLLARGAGGEPLGCVALRPMAVHRCCEMKRLFVVPGGRGRALGLALTQSAIGKARQLGYAELCLDTLPLMIRAASLYLSLGFERTVPYYGPTPPGTIFMRLKL
jgi:GNAT superfamily N-acetyltransferase